MNQSDRLNLLTKPKMAISRDIVQKYVESALKSEVLEDSFMPFSIHHDNEESSHKTDHQGHGIKRILLTISTNSEPEIIIKHYVSLIAQVKSPEKFQTLFGTLRLLVQQHPYLGKAVCEALLNSEYLNYHKQDSWMISFGLINEILPNVDYKGVRDILKYLLEIIHTLPERFDISIIPQLDTLHATFSIILDREACLLPAYLSLDEIQKKITQGRAPIWNFAELFYHFVESFRPTAQLFSTFNRPELLPVVGFSTNQGNPSWRLDPMSAKFQLKGLLPYKDKLKEPQVGQLRYLLEQHFSREMIYNILSLNMKPTQIPRCSELTEQLTISIVSMMERSPIDITLYEQQTTDTNEHLFQWLHMSNNMIHYIPHPSSNSFNNFVDTLCERIKAKNLVRGREHLMWAMLQYITSTGKSNVGEFLSTTKLFDILYSGRTVIPLPNLEFPLSPHVMAAASVWLQLTKRAEVEQTKFSRPPPQSLQLHLDYLNIKKQSQESVETVSFKHAVLFNAFVAQAQFANFVDCLTKLDPANNMNLMQAKPLSISLLDSLTSHCRIILLHSIAARISNIAIAKPDSPCPYILTPALIETYGRLSTFADNDSYGVKSLVTQLFNGNMAIWKTNAWHVFNVLLEMFSHRLNQVSSIHKYSLLIQLHNLSSLASNAGQMQLGLTMEATVLRLLLGFENYEALNMPGNTRHPNDPKSLKNMISVDSEELNKVLILVIARSALVTASEHLSANILEDILNEVNKVTPLTWSSSCMNFFPPIMKEFYSRNASNKDTDRALLKTAIEEEYRKWKVMPNEETLIAHFSQPNGPPLFICILWKMSLENEFISPVAYRILENIRIRTIAAHLRTFVDYLVYEFADSVGGPNVNRYAEALNDLIVKFQVITIDRLLLCMCLRCFDGSESQICYFIIQLLLLKISDFKTTVQKYCKMQTPEHWKPNANTYEMNSEFLRQHPQKYYHDFLSEANIPSNSQTLPSFFSNVCLRFLPVFDVLIHRAIEVKVLNPKAALRIKVDSLLDEFGCLYKFHERPLTYLYNTLHYYDAHLSASLKKKLTGTIVFAFNDIRPTNWCLSEPFIQYLQRPSPQPNGPSEHEDWTPGQDYFRNLISRLVDTLNNKNSYHTDWRFNEFPNIKAHTVHSTAIELMSLPLPPTVVGNSILELVLNHYVNQDRSTMSQWMNAIGLIMTALPPSYYSVLNTKILEYMKSPLLTSPAYTGDILHLMNFCDSHERMYESQISYLVALTHAIWHHSNTGQILSLHNFWRNEIKKVLETESQFLFACCLIGPFLPRLERSRIMMDVVVILYEMLAIVDSTTEIQHLNTICDFFYHIKYMFTGDAVKNDIERCIRNFKPKLQYCLRFITHLNVNQGGNDYKSDQ